MRSTRRQRLLYVDNQATWHKLVIQIQIPVFLHQADILLVQHIMISSKLTLLYPLQTILDDNFALLLDTDLKLSPTTILVGV